MNQLFFAGKFKPFKTMENQKIDWNKTKSTLLHALSTVGGMALPTTYMTHPTYHTLQMVSLYYFLQVVYSQKVSPRRNYTFTSSIRLASSQPGIERTRKRAESGEISEM